jgi:hypothetical protein
MHNRDEIRNQVRQVVDYLLRFPGSIYWLVVASMGFLATGGLIKAILASNVLARLGYFGATIVYGAVCFGLARRRLRWKHPGR